MPVVAIEKGEQPREGLVRDVDVGVALLQFVAGEEATVEVRHPPEEADQVRLAVPRRLAQALMKEPA